jgi:hypothetical protein
MSKMKTILVAFSDDECVFGNLNLKLLMKKALRVEQRMIGRVMIENEQSRYNVYCERIEFYANKLVVEGKARTIDLGTEQPVILAALVKASPSEARKNRLTASFFPQEQLTAYWQSLETLAKRAKIWDNPSLQAKAKFFRMAQETGLNVVEIQQPWLYDLGEDTEELDLQGLKKSFLALEISDKTSEDKGGGHFIALREQIERVVSETNKGIPAAINFSDLRHDVIAEVLHDFVFRSGKPMYVDVIYGDGSKAAPMPMFTLKQKTEVTESLKQMPAVKVGMMSSRHSHEGLDQNVAFYWFRNQEISTGRTQAEIDEAAYKISQKLFLKLRTEGPCRLAFYQTGFQPAIVGFYRALTEELIARIKLNVPMEVTPYYYMGGDYKVGKVWS